MAFVSRIIATLYTFCALAQDGTRVDPGIQKLNIVCTGAADARPVVVLAGPSTMWKGVQAAVPTAIRTCAYDRTGSAKSAPGPEPGGMDAEVNDIHALLERSNITGPIVFVGQSIGGILARLYVQKYPDSMAGVILLDPTDEDDLVFNTTVNHWIIVRELEGPMGDGARSAARARQTDPAPFGDRPLIVIGAGKRAQPPGPSNEQWLKMRTSRDSHVKELSNLSRNSKFVLEPLSGHNIEHDNPNLVAEAIQELVNKLALGRKLRQ
jgi:pimeloyl-ACP methyl ester carboxylesterase